jgi:hypothetical protein
MPFVVCDVLRAGAAGDSNVSGTNGTVYIALRDQAGSFPEQWFWVNPQRDKEILAAALTAIAANLPVEAGIAAIAPYSKLDRLYVMRGTTGILS